MNLNIVKGYWQRLNGALLALLGSLTGDRPRVLAGRHQQVAGRVHIAYGVAQLNLARDLASAERFRSRRMT